MYSVDDRIKASVCYQYFVLILQLLRKPQFGLVFIRATYQNSHDFFNTDQTPNLNIQTPVFSEASTSRQPQA